MSARSFQSPARGFNSAISRGLLGPRKRSFSLQNSPGPIQEHAAAGLPNTTSRPPTLSGLSSARSCGDFTSATKLINPFDFNLSAVLSGSADRSAAAPSPQHPPGGVAAEPIVGKSHSFPESSIATGGYQQAPAAEPWRTKAAGLQSKYAAKRREKAEEHRFVLNEEWFWADIVEKPLFLRGNWR